MTAEQAGTGDDVERELAGYDGYNTASFQENLDLMARARDHCPVAHSERQGGYWLVTRYEDVRAVLTDPERFSSRNGLALPRNPNRPPTPPIDQDGAAHRDFRRILNPHLAPAAVRGYEDEIRQVARDLLSSHLSSGRIDAASSYANPLPALVLARTLFGLGQEYDNAILAVKTAIEDMGRNASDGASVSRAWRASFELCAQIVDRRSKELPRDDLISAVLEGNVGGAPIARDVQIGTLTITLLGGLKTTTGLIGTMIATAVDHPELRPQLQDPEWVGHAFNEFLRMSPPLSWFGREATTATKIGDRQIAAGDAVMLHIGSANRDEEAFPSPDFFHPDRPEVNRQLGFGFGVHRCVGAHLAKLEVTVAVTEFVRTLADLRWQDSATRVIGTGQEWSATSLPITFAPVTGLPATPRRPAPAAPHAR
jgi:cytochrome P450